MTIRTWLNGTFDDYLDYDFPLKSGRATDRRVEEVESRLQRLRRFPHAVLLQVSFAEMDFANLWCWQQFGPAEGECLQADSDYPACRVDGKHEHKGEWLTHWLAKTDYDFGYNEWYFASEVDRDRFVGFLPQLNWGEAFPKQPEPL